MGERGAQTPLVKQRIVRHERQTLETGCNFAPNRVESGCIGRICRRKSVNGGVETPIIIGIGTNQSVNAIDEFPVAHDNDTDRTDARGTVVGSFKIYGGEVGQNNGKAKPERVKIPM